MKFKEYIQDQDQLFPHSFDDFISPSDPVRIINKVVDSLDLSSILQTYNEKGCSAYHPKMLLKIIVYAYLRNTYSSRKIEDLTANDLRFMWLSGMQRPDHNTINRFRSSRLKKKGWPEQLKRNEANSAQMGNRNSMSKTDPDATFMRMKEDHMGNGQLKPAYNTQINSENGIITNYTFAQTTADTTTYKDHTEQFKNMYGHYPKESICDAGYGSEENYLYVQEKGITPYIKYNYFHKEQSKKWKNDPFKSCNFYYNKKQDCYYCPMGQPMRKVYTTHPKTKTGFIQELTHYQAIGNTDKP